MANPNIVAKIRAFNRFYMPKMNLLGNHYLGSEYSAAEARVFFEIYEHEGCHAAHIAKAMNIDKSYLSKILASHEKNGFLQRLPSETDRRSYKLYLTEKGKKRTEEFIRKSEEDISGLLRALSEEEKLRMEQALDTITELLEKGGGTNENHTI